MLNKNFLLCDPKNALIFVVGWANFIGVLTLTEMQIDKAWFLVQPSNLALEKNYLA